MNSFFKSAFLYILLLNVIFNYSTAQNQTNNKSIHLFYEKVYLHTDREIYYTGDDIWFKAYLVNPISNYLTNTSNNLYVEIISPENKIIDRIVIRLDRGLGNGDFKLNNDLINGTYAIRAYTQWMLNFDDNFIFKKNILIKSSKIQNYNEKKDTIITNQIFFMPEGGSMVKGISNRIAFKAIDKKGNSIDVNGKIINNKGDTLTSFESTYRGMGSFLLIPAQNDELFAEGYYTDGTFFRQALPKSSTIGFAFFAQPFDTANIIVTISTNDETFDIFKNQKLYILARARGRIYNQGEFILSNKIVRIKIPKNKFPTAIVSLTLLDEQNRAFCERLVYIENKNDPQLIVSVASEIKSEPDTINSTEIMTKSTGEEIQVYTKNIVQLNREKITLKINTINDNCDTCRTYLSLSAIDAKQAFTNLNNIKSYLLLTSEIKGNIENPYTYFDPDNKQRYKQMDLLLLTQGWRNYLWKNILDSVYKVRYMMEPGIAITGYLRQKFGNKPLPDKNITLFLPGAKNGSIFSTKTLTDGKFYLEGLEFYGQQKIIITSKTNKGSDAGWLSIDSMFSKPYKIINSNYLLPDTFVIKNNYETEKIYLKKKDYKEYRITDTIELEEIKISAQKQRENEQMLNYITQNGKPDYDVKITSQDCASAFDLAGLIVNKIPVARLSVDSGDRRIVFNVAGSLQSPRFIVDGREYQRNDENAEIFIYGLLPEQIERILVSNRDFSSPAGMGYVVSIYTKPNAYEKEKMNVINTFLNGYYEARQFFNPGFVKQNDEYVPSHYPTIFWKADIITDNKGEAIVTFNNYDVNAKIIIMAEGITSRGCPVVYVLKLR